ncbi:type II secretion system protein GspM [Arenimonas fontis]|uniref:General secretion pathway protein GspM n=1 Tax=Arenimonas fontis TaxID=2608255 RepID=A0A5B2ZCN3_9GAMM|nr:type II secretion system protein GspM [Arenimonas fontis]KAA2284980.1 general secretion pathway protein GspM [Arenimonas fontis]
MAGVPERPVRLGLLAAAAALAYFLLLHWWFTAPMLAMGAEIERLQREELALRMEIAQRPELEAELQRVLEFGAGDTGFLPEANRQLATAALVQRLESVVNGAAGASGQCRITARTPSESQGRDPFVRATVQVRLMCGMGELAAVLHQLEGGNPQLFVDNLDMLSRRSYLGGAEAGGMDVSFDLYGYLAQPAGGEGDD